MGPSASRGIITTPAAAVVAITITSTSVISIRTSSTSIGARGGGPHPRRCRRPPPAGLLLPSVGRLRAATLLLRLVTAQQALLHREEN